MLAVADTVHMPPWATSPVRIERQAAAANPPIPAFVSLNTYRGAPARHEATPFQITSGHPNGWLDKLFQQLQEMSRWNDNWDGEGAAAISGQTVHDATRFLNRLPAGRRAPRVMPSPLGVVVMSWTDGDLYVSAQFEGDNTYSFVADIGDDRRDGENIPAGHPLPEELLERIPLAG